jgi:opacity protein-like surface antigen
MRLQAGFVLILAVGSLPASAQTPTPPRDSTIPCAQDSNRRAFDFWIGKWEVTGRGGQNAGSSVVEPISGGCGLLESWTSAGGNTGKSLSTYNPQLRRWQQYWVGGGGDVTEFRESEWRDGSLSFIARGRNPAERRRMTFTLLPEGRVRQHGERSNDEGGTWTTEYDLTYRPRAAP